ncbi:hypothetical protein CBI36_14745 [Acetobacter oryzifermentans]|uniref:Uncharacterized protein n=1 Tax=Acetobacter oryzifermentans TaxID=1633874 RepID=A0ABC8CEX8_9PROT|nr:hypothetical protein [Acetobacter oryzifermentans]ASL41514.1 hypothetical protein CBI36_14745 [Acetobacter oryzifermentans]
MVDPAYPLLSIAPFGTEGPRTKAGPVECLGFTRKGENQHKIFLFRDSVGQVRELRETQLFRRSDIVALFGGDISWLKEHFPKRSTVHKALPGGEVAVGEMVVDFVIRDAAACLIKGCYIQHLTNPHTANVQNPTEKAAIITNDSENAGSERAPVLKILFYAFMLAAGAFVLGLRAGRCTA